MAEERTRDRILFAAGPIFAEKGFRDATVREICAAAQVNLASVNYYFGDKDQLYLEAVRFARNSIAERFPLPDWDAEMDAEQKLRGFIKSMLQRLVVLQQAPWQVRLVMNEVLQPTDALQHLVKEYFEPIFFKLLETVDELAPVELSRDQRKKIGFSIVGQCLFYRYSSGMLSVMLDEGDADEFVVEELADHIVRFSLAAIRQADWGSEEGPDQGGEPGWRWRNDQVPHPPRKD